MQINPVATFLQEADDLLAQIEQSALSLGEADDTADTINQLFRAFHTIKGSGAMCGLESVASFTHHVETLLDMVREGAVEVSPGLSELLLAAGDQIRLLLDAEQGGNAVDLGSSEALIAKLVAFSGADSGPHAAPVAHSSAIVEEKEPPTGGDHEWQIRFRPEPGLLSCGGNPVLLFRDLRNLGPCHVVGHTDLIPALDALQADVCYLSWTITLRTDSDLNAIRDVFIFVEDGSEIEIEPLDSAPGASEARAAENPEPGELRAVPVASLTVAARAPQPAAERARKETPNESSVRVPAARLDRLVNLVGELVMNQSRLAQTATQIGAPELANPVQELDRLVAELREHVLDIRMLPIGTLFGRYRRLVHDLSAELGKEADLVAEGGETELDKSILDRLGEPLVHLLRNSIGHGIELADERVAKGKPRRGTIRLTATHTGSAVVVSIEDDGRGIDRDAVRAKAVERQLISSDAVLSDREVFNLILLPGFSTADRVTNVSGRGVGMDVVKKQIDALRGSLSFASEEGRSTRVSLTLPLTLAIIDGLLVEVGSDRFIVPMSAVTENVELLGSERERHNGRNVIAVRGELVPYIDLRMAFRIPGEAPQIERVVIVRHEEHRVGLVVDRVVGTHQTVIQSLGRFLHQIDVVSGATIMGDGCVALILDIAAVVRLADISCQQDLAIGRGGAELLTAR